MRWSLLPLFVCTTVFGLCPCYEPLTNPYMVPYADTCVCCRFCCGSYEGAAEALFFRLGLCQLDYAIRDARSIDDIGADSLPVGCQLRVPTDFKLGFRGYLGFVSQDSCQDFRLEYTWFHRRYHSSFAPTDDELFWPTLGHPLALNTALYNGDDVSPTNVRALAKGSLHVDLDSVSLQFAQRALLCCVHLRTFAGVYWFKLQNRLSARYRGSFEFPAPGNLNSVRYSQNQKLWGAGPQLGVEGFRPIVCGFGVTGRIWASVTAGRRRGIVDEFLVAGGSTPISTFLKTELRARCSVVPIVNARLGLHYTFPCCGCFQLFVEGGYEFLSYTKALHLLTFTDQGGTSQTQCDSFNLTGAYLSAKLKY